MRWALLVALLTTFGCATLRGGARLAVGGLGGAGVGAAAGATLSPNDASRGLNALVFGLSGALAGGILAWLTEPPGPSQQTQETFRSREERGPEGRHYVLEVPVRSPGQLPPFVRERLQPLVIEESVERDAVAEDGSLHEPHKVYRIQRPAELFARPLSPAEPPSSEVRR